MDAVNPPEDVSLTYYASYRVAAKTPGKITESRAQRFSSAILVIVGSIFLATCDCLLHGPSACSLFHPVYLEGPREASLLFFAGYLIGGACLALASRFIVKNKRAITYISFVVILLTILTRFFYAETNLALCLCCVFFAALMVPFFKYLVFFDIIAQRNTTLCVLSLAFGQVGKIILLSTLNDATPLVQKLTFVLCAVTCMLSLICFQKLNATISVENTSSLLSSKTEGWATFFAKSYS